MNNLYWTECDFAFWNFLLKNGFDHNDLMVVNEIKAVRFNFDNKCILGWAESRSEYNRARWSEYQYISNKDLIEKLKGSKQFMNNKKIAIKVGNNQELSRIVQEFLFSKGYSWKTGKDVIKIGSFGNFIHLNYIEENKLAHGPLEPNYIGYNAETQFGEIITLLSKPPKPVIKIKNDAGQEYEADFGKNPGYVTFGCAKISTSIFFVLNDALDNKFAPDSKSVEQIKIGRGLFTPADIKAIVEHPDFNKSCLS